MAVFTKYWSELSPDDLYGILQARCEVFLLEQRIVCQDMDGIDKISYHIYMTDDSGKIIGYLRVFESDGSVHIGRVLVTRESRGKGYGRILMENALSVASDKFNGLPVILHSQEQAVGFYEKLGFVICTQRFIEEGVPHFGMVAGSRSAK